MELLGERVAESEEEGVMEGSAPKASASKRGG